MTAPGVNAFDALNTFGGYGNPGWRFAPDDDIEVTTQLEVFLKYCWNGQLERSDREPQWRLGHLLQLATSAAAAQSMQQQSVQCLFCLCNPC